jgi:Protein of unknown function (DUF3105)
MTKARDEEKQRKRAAQRAAAERSARRSSLMRRGAVLVVVVIVAAVLYDVYARRQLLQNVKTASYTAGMHTAGPIFYIESPPIGGQHNVVWQNCGIYNAPIHNEHAVHSMEHGAVWITYRPDLAQDQIQTLRAVASDDYLLLSPYPGLAHPVVASAWNHQLTFERADDPGLAAFIARYKNNPETTPEFGALCAGGTSALATTDSLSTGPGPMTR